MSKSISKKTLKLNLETVRKLNAAQLGQIVGGGGHTFSCRPAPLTSCKQE